MVKRFLPVVLLALFAAPASAQITTQQCYDGTRAFFCDDFASLSRRVKIVEAPTLTVSGTVAATQSGAWAVTANAGTNLNTSALALESGGNLAAIASALAGTLTVGTHAVTQSGTWTVQPGNTANTTPWLFSISEGGVTADVLDLTNSNPQTVAIVDGSGNQITSFGGGTQYTEGDTDATITGTVGMWEDAGNAIVATSASKPLPVEIIAGAGSGGTAAQDNSAFTGGTTNVTPMGALYDTTPPTITDGSIGAPRMTSTRVLMTDASATTQPVSAASLPLPSGASTAANQSTVIGHVDGIEGLLTTIDADTGTLAGAVSGTEVQVDVLTMPTTTVTATDLDVQSGGADILSTTAFNAAFGTAGSSDTQVLSVQGIASGTALPVTATNLDVQIGGSDTVTVTATNLDVQIGGSDSLTIGTLPSIPAGTNNIGDVDVLSSALPTGASTAANQSTVIGHVDGLEGLLTTIDADTSSLTTAGTRGAYLSVGTTEDEHAVKASAGTLWSISATNVAATVAFLKCEDDTAANTAPGTDTPEFRAAIPGATTGGGFHMSFPRGLAFANAWTCWIVEGAADSDVTEVGANEVMVTYTYN